MLSFITICILLWVGHFLREKVKFLRTLYLPSCVISGVIGLVIIQAFKAFGQGEVIADYYFGWSKLPGFLINIVFACLFLAVSLPGIKTIWSRASSQLAYGQIVAWGQYLVAIGAWLIALRFIFPDLPAVVAAILPVGFEGGHGTAVAMKDVFMQNGFEAGKDLALTSATMGIISAVVFGMVLVNWASRKGYTVKTANPDTIPEDDRTGIIPVDQRPVIGKLTVNSDAIGSLTIHIAIIGLAVGIGYLLKQSLVGIESMVDNFRGVSAGDEPTYRFLSGFPLFPLCMIGGLVVQLCEQKFDSHKIIDLGLTKTIQNCSLDFLVVAAIATINVQVVLAMLIPLSVLVAVGVVWNVFCVMVVSRWVFGKDDAWFERAIAEMGQSMGVTATGLLLLRVVDPEYKTPAVDAFAYKQLLHEPFMGGGLWTAAAVPLIFAIGPVPVLAIAGGAILAWLFVIIFFLKR